MPHKVFDTFYFYLRMVQSTAAVMVNLLPLICVMKHKHLRGPAGILVASLAISDALHGLFTCILLPLKTLHKAVRITNLTLQLFTTKVQLMSLSLLAMERRNSLLAQLNRSKKWSVRKVTLLVSGAWIALTAWNMGFAMNSIFSPNESDVGILNLFPRYYIYCNIGFAVLTILVIAVCYGSIAKISCLSAQQVASHLPESAQQRERRRADLRITKMMVLVVGVSFVLYTPVITSFLFYPEPPTDWQRIIHQLTIIVHDINFWINPLIYVWRNKKFRRAIFNLFPACCSRAPNAVGHINAVSQQVPAPVPGPGPFRYITMNALVPRREVIINLQVLPNVQ